MPSIDYCVVLSHTSHPGNIGACARAAKTMGITDLRLVNPVDFKNETAYARSSGAEDLLHHANVYATLDAALFDCHFTIAMSARSRHTPYPATLCASQLPTYIRENIQPGQRVGLVFGNETNGLDNSEIAQCHLQVVVPTNPKFSSLNLASCVQIIAFLVQQHPNSTPQKYTRCEAASHEKINALVATISHHVFSKPSPKSTLDMAKFQQILFRLRPSNDEIDFLHGICKRLLKSHL